MFRFLIAAAVLTLSLPPLVSYLFDQGYVSRIPSFLHESTWLVATLTSIIFVYLYRMGKPALFVQFYLLSLVVKLIACLTYTLVIILKSRSGAVANVVYLLAVYFLYTALEIAFLYRKISRSPRS